MDRYFKENQKKLLELINLDEIKFLLDINTPNPIVKVTPNSWHALKDIKGDQAEIECEIHTDPYIYRNLFPLLQKSIFAKNIYQPMYFTTYTGNPTAGGGTNFTNWETGWNTAWALNTSENTGNSYTIISDRSGTSYRIFRCFCPFDSSSITSISKISSATLGMYRDDSFAPMINTDNTTLEIVLTTQASSSVLATSDYNQVIRTSKGSLNLTSTVNGQRNNITFTDITAINKSGISFLGVITGLDLNNVAPTGSNDYGAANANSPLLSATYTTPVGVFLANFV